MGNIFPISSDVLCLFVNYDEGRIYFKDEIGNYKELTPNNSQLFWWPNSSFLIRCKRNHAFNRTAYEIWDQKTCFICNDIYLQELKEKVNKKGAIIISKQFTHMSHELELKCKNNHLFSLNAYDIEKARWYCPLCFMHKESQKRGGILISDQYKGYYSKHTFKCKKNHIFEATHFGFGQLKQEYEIIIGTKFDILGFEWNETETRYKWCPECFRFDQQKDLNDWLTNNKMDTS